MNKKKAVVCTILFAIISVGGVITAMLIKPFDSEFSMFHAFSPCFAGFWLVEIIEKFYKWLIE